jgi:hypothetical protein
MNVGIEVQEDWAALTGFIVQCDGAPFIEVVPDEIIHLVGLGPGVPIGDHFEQANLRWGAKRDEVVDSHQDLAHLLVEKFKNIITGWESVIRW